MATQGLKYLSAILLLIFGLQLQVNAQQGVLCPMAADICLALDDSTSIVAANGGYANWYTYILGFAKSLVNSFPIGPNDTRIGALIFSTDVSVQFELADYTNKNDLLNAVDNLNIQGGETNIAGALRVCRTDILAKARPNVPHIVILVTDGVANVNAQNTLPEANLTKAAGAIVYTIGVTDQTDANQLNAIASSPSSSHYFYVSDYSLLNTVLTNLIQTSCITTSTVSPTPAASSSTSKILTSITPSTTTSQTTTGSTSTAPLSGSNIGAKTPSSDIANEAANCTGSVLDIVLILDQSTSIVYAPGSYDNWYKHILGFAVELASAYTIGPNNVQIGVVKFSDVSAPAFFLNTYKDNSSLIAAIQGLTIEGGETNIAAAQSQTRNLMFSPANGARPGVKQIVYLLTDGVPNRQENSTFPENNLLKATGATIYTIGVTSLVDTNVCQKLSSSPVSDHYFYVNSFSQLKTIVGSIVGNTCNHL